MFDLYPTFKHFESQAAFFQTLPHLLKSPNFGRFEGFSPVFTASNAPKVHPTSKIRGTQNPMVSYWRYWNVSFPFGSNKFGRFLIWEDPIIFPIFLWKIQFQQRNSEHLGSSWPIFHRFAGSSGVFWNGSFSVSLWNSVGSAPVASPFSLEDKRPHKRTKMNLINDLNVCVFCWPMKKNDLQKNVEELSWKKLQSIKTDIWLSAPTPAWADGNLCAEKPWRKRQGKTAFLSTFLHTPCLFHFGIYIVIIL